MTLGEVTLALKKSAQACFKGGDHTLVLLQPGWTQSTWSFCRRLVADEAWEFTEECLLGFPPQAVIRWCRKALAMHLAIQRSGQSVLCWHHTSGVTGMRGVTASKTGARAGTPLPNEGWPCHALTSRVALLSVLPRQGAALQEREWDCRTVTVPESPRHPFTLHVSLIVDIARILGWGLFMESTQDVMETEAGGGTQLTFPLQSRPCWCFRAHRSSQWAKHSAHPCSLDKGLRARVCPDLSPPPMAPEVFITQRVSLSCGMLWPTKHLIVI